MVGMRSQALAPNASTFKSGWGGHLGGIQLNKDLSGGPDDPSGVLHTQLSPTPSAARPSPTLQSLTRAVSSSECRAVPGGTLPESLSLEIWVEGLHLMRRIQPSPQRAI